MRFACGDWSLLQRGAPGRLDRPWRHRERCGQTTDGVQPHARHTASRHHPHRAMSTEAGSAAGQMLLRRGLMLEYATLGWNVVGVIVLTVAAIAAGSVALAGFGVDSLIEIV